MGQNKQHSRRSNSAIARIVIWSIVLIVLIGVFATVMLASALGGMWSNIGSSHGGLSYSDAGSYQIGGGTIAETVNRIDIVWFDGDIQILPAEEGVTEITISEDYNGTDEDDRLRFRVHKGELQIKFRKSSWWIGADRAPNKTLTIRVPQEIFRTLGRVHVETTDSDILFEGSAEKLDVEAVRGNLTVRGTVKHLDIDSVDVAVDFTGDLNEGDFDGVNVTAVLRLYSARALDIDGVDSDITLYLADTVTGFRVDYDSVGGSVSVNDFESVMSRGDYSHYWGDGSLEIESDGVDSKLKIYKLTNN